ncbi:hypothetical protein [Chlamydiifrater phoenicopteri]|uniref:hypothetical protein n=1 Tax=Chlamydiifrater phoenicopteri TaxID=2681469 RepID=UPI001BCE7B7D|nr:hypothetical protein [Chlamydiifrater phoenicopteri]
MTAVTGNTSQVGKKGALFVGDQDVDSEVSSAGGNIVNISTETLSRLLAARPGGTSGGAGGYFMHSAGGMPFWTMPSPSGAASPEALAQEISLIRSQLAQQSAEIRAIKEDTFSIRKNSRFVRPLPTSSCGPVFLAALLLSITLVAVAAIVLCVLGLMGILPQVTCLMQGQANLVWTIVSASIAAIICTISVISISLYASKQVRYNSSIGTN